MDSPVSVVVAEIVMQNIEERALATCSETLSLCVMLKIRSLLYTKTKLNKQNTSIQFTKEIEGNGEISFLHCLVTLENNALRTTVYRKPTHTDRPHDQTS